MFFALGAEVRGQEGPQRASCLLASMVDLFLAQHRGFAVFGKFLVCVACALSVFKSGSAVVCCSLMSK